MHKHKQPFAYVELSGTWHLPAQVSASPLPNSRMTVLYLSRCHSIKQSTTGDHPRLKPCVHQANSLSQPICITNPKLVPNCKQQLHYQCHPPHQSPCVKSMRFPSLRRTNSLHDYFLSTSVENSST